jgi:hypothetical protein
MSAFMRVRVQKEARWNWTFERRRERRREESRRMGEN